MKRKLRRSLSYESLRNLTGETYRCSWTSFGLQSELDWFSPRNLFHGFSLGGSYPV